MARGSKYRDSLRPDRLSRPTLRRDRTARWSSLCLIAAFVAVATVATALATPPPIPVVAELAGQELHVGKIVWVRLVTPDLAAAKTFYAGLFGWTFRDVGTDHAEADLDGRPIAGLFQRPIKAGEHRQPAWLGFISTSDVDATTKTALQHGGKVLFGPHDFPNLGRGAVLEDPQGAVFGILRSSRGDLPDVLAGPGAWIWSSLITTDPDTDAAFYQTLFDYDVFDVSSQKDAQHLLLASGNYARASVNSLPARAVHAHPHWINYVRVGDAVATAARVVALGGRVIEEPRIDRHGSKVALVADPLGAPFGLLEWPENVGREVTK